MQIDLRSDTVTRPTPGMLDAMFTAKVGDDVFEEDPSIIALETKAATLFGHEQALFCPSGTMTNQIAIRVHTQPGHEVICDQLSHIYHYEGGGIAVNSQASVRLLTGDRGRISASDVAANINPNDVHFPITSLVSLENTCNKGGGCYYDLESLKSISTTCRNHQLALHLDGARLFNALVATGVAPQEHGPLFDSISICLSKGLGAPVGSLLLGSSNFIKQARRVRKVLGGGMRQAGFLAAAGSYALDHQVERLAEDHLRARVLGSTLSELPYVKEVLPVETNIVVFQLLDGLSTEEFLNKMEAAGLRAVPFGPQKIRLVTHHDFTDDQLEAALEILQKLV